MAKAKVVVSPNANRIGLAEQPGYAGSINVSHAGQRVAKHDDLIDLLTLELGQGDGESIGIIVNVRQEADAHTEHLE